MKRFLALALTLTLLAMAAGAAAEGFSFRNGITWSSTPEDVKAAESGNEIETNEYDNAGIAQIVIEVDDVTAAGLEAELSYIFLDNVLAGCVYEFDDDAATLEKLDRAMTAKYGDSAPMDFGYLGEVMGPFGSIDGYLEGVSVCWTLEDNTLIILTDVNGDAEIDYLNVPYLLELTEAAAAKTDEINTDGL